MIARDPDGRRVLLVQPMLAPLADELVQTFIASLAQCSCGGYDCLEPASQMAAACVFAAHAWPKISMFHRIEVIEEAEPDDPGLIALAAESTPHFSEIDDIFLLERIGDFRG